MSNPVNRSAEASISNPSGSDALFACTTNGCFRLESYGQSDSNLMLWGFGNPASLESDLLPSIEVQGAARVERSTVSRKAVRELDPRKSISQLVAEGVLLDSDQSVDLQSQTAILDQSITDQSEVFHRGDRQATSLYQFSGENPDAIEEAGSGTGDSADEVLHRGDRAAASSEQASDDSTIVGGTGGDRGSEQSIESKPPNIKVVFQSHDSGSDEDNARPNFSIAKDGTITVLSNPEQNPTDEIVIEVERDLGQLIDPTAEQLESVSALVTYLSKRIQEQYKDAVEDGINLEDKQGLVPPETRSSSGAVPPPESSLPPSTQQQIEDMNRLPGSGQGSMPATDARDYFPPSDLPRLPAETDQLAALKNVVAGFESRGQEEPYFAVQERGDRGWGVGRYGTTSWGFFNWLYELSDEDLEEIEALEGKNAKGKPRIPKGTASRLRATRDALRKRTPTDDPNAKEQLEFMHKMSEGKEQISKEEINKFFPPELQELYAADQISKFAEQSLNKETGEVDVGKVVLAMHLGKFPTDEDLSRPENQSLMKAAENAFPLAVQSTSEPKSSVTWNESDGKVLGDPNDYFFTQFRNPKWNPNGPSRSNNCGPASLAMAIRAFGGDATSDPESLITNTRVAMTGNSNKSALTSNTDVLRGARAAGLNADYVQSMQDINDCLSEGQMVVALGNPSVYGRRLSANDYSHYNGMHFILVAGTIGGAGGERRYVINDPLSRKGSMTISEQEMQGYVRAAQQQGYRPGVAVWS